ncbi:tRNA 2'-phosphotransferase [Paraconiothyrium brasiliense]|uniref:2'-phosphotransferase n=1 Tax=Paraconiothyrium brasiliense TaxID=300254 RepID=A0ABR3R853_9PLEO
MARGGRGGRNPASLPREQQVSRKVSWLLRHGANSEGLKLGKGGYVGVDEALRTRCLTQLKVAFPELRDMVRTNDKQRFSMVLKERLEKVGEDEAEGVEGVDVGAEEDEADRWVIRANQGHSIKVDTEGLLTPITVEKGNVPDVVVHGTDEAAWNLILKSGGLRRMTRNHIHFASGLPAGFKALDAGEATGEGKEAPPVISGMRKSSTVLIYIDIKAALEAGIKFFVSENGVILSEGNEKGLLPYEFFKRVESRKKGGDVLMSGGVLPDGVVVDMDAWEKEVGSRGGKGGRGRGGRGGRGGRDGSGGGGGGEKAKATDDSRDLLAAV